MASSSATVQVEVVSAEASIFSGEARFVALPGESGELGILPRHIPLITRIKPGAVRIERPDGSEEMVFVAGGLLEVQPGTVTVLADTAVRAHDIDEAAALEAKQRAEAAMENRQGDFEYATASAELAEAMAQLQTIQRLRRRTGR
jgi:F-type H+-transporting ATPase subunit epsilon